MNRLMFHKDLPSPVRHWLLDTGSLTRRLQQHSQQTFSVSVLRQRWEKPRLAEAKALGIPVGQFALVREVILYGKDQPWVYARSVLPQTTLNGSLRFLRRLGNKPLGALLFGNPSIQREPLVVQRFLRTNLPPALQCSEQAALWGRYSIFRQGKNGILVSEIFLPPLVDSIMLSP